MPYAIPKGVFDEERDTFEYRGLRFDLHDDCRCPVCKGEPTELAKFERMDTGLLTIRTVHACTCYECDLNFFYEETRDWL